MKTKFFTREPNRAFERESCLNVRRHVRCRYYLLLLLLCIGLSLESTAKIFDGVVTTKLDGNELSDVNNDFTLYTDTIRGVVIDFLTKTPITGATVKVEGGTGAVITDAQGRFSVDVSGETTLTISSIGYEPKSISIPAANEKDLTILLSRNTTMLDQVVVVGYQTKRRGEVTGSISSIDSKVLQENRSGDLVKSLQGAAPGLIVNDVGGLPGNEQVSILIRGTHTLGDNSPLFVVDGVPQTSISNISPYDIENISVLKDASAAIYGARAANGVIIVTTKRGKSGKNRLNLNVEQGVHQLTRIPKVMNSEQYAIYRNEAFEAIGQAPIYTEEDIQLYKDHSDPLMHPNTDWFRATFRNNAPTSNYNLSTSGGTTNAKYYISGTYNHQGTNYSSKDGNFDRYLLRSNVDITSIKYVKLGLDLDLRLEKSKMPPVSPLNIVHRIWFNWPVEVARYPNGLPGTVHENGNTTVVNSFAPGFIGNNRQVARPKLSIEINMDWITHGLTFIGYGAFDFRSEMNTTFFTPTLTYNYNQATKEYDPHVATWPSNGHTSLTQTSRKYQEELYHTRLAYTRTFGDHSINAFAAMELEQLNDQQISAGRRDLFSPSMIQLFAGLDDGRTVGGNAIVSGRINYFGSLDYDYKKKYFLTFIFRRDGSFNFPPNHRFGNFPSLSAGWNICNEPFMKSAENVLTNLKLRASFGIMGNDRISPFQYLSSYSTSSFMVFGEGANFIPALVLNNVPNPNVTWERSKMFNVGTDFRLFGSLTGSFDYFYEKRSDILIKRNLSVPDFTGIQLPFENLGRVNNFGMETNLSYSNSVGEFNYQISGNLTFNRNKIVFMDEAPNVPSYQKQEGHPINTILAYVADGLFQSQNEIDNTPHIGGAVPGFVKYVDLNGDKTINGLDRKRFYKSTIPELQYSFGSSVNYKGIGLSFTFQGAGGALNAIRMNDNGTRPIEWFTERWTEDNKNAKHSRPMVGFSTYDRLSTFDFVSASYLRLKNLTLSYELTSLSGVKKIFDQCSVYLRGRNLLTFSENKIFDPEFPFVPDSRGNRGRYYPQTRDFTVGAAIGF